MARNRDARVKMLTARLVTFTRMFVVGAGVVTALSVGLVVSLQLGFFFMTKRWSSFPLSRIFDPSEVDVPKTYVLASESSAPRTQTFTGWLLDLPAIVVLFVALALLALSYACLTTAEKRLATVPADGEAEKDRD